LDELVGGWGRDWFGGGPGGDEIRGGRDGDIAWPSTGSDQVSLGPGDDVARLRADGKADAVDCGPGLDKVIIVHGSDASDTFLNCEEIVGP
jgi:hypothetical protein